jgi:hypothetical protein
MKSIALTQNKFTLIDDEDFDRVSKYKWYARKDSKTNTWYAMRNYRTYGVHKTILLHRFITDAPKWFDVDHKDRNGLNNQKGNLDVCEHSKNMMNRSKQKNNKSGYKGVTYHKTNKRFQATITFNGKQKHLGYYNTALEASKAYEVKYEENMSE